MRQSTIVLMLLGFAHASVAAEVNFGKQMPTEQQVIGALKQPGAATGGDAGTSSDEGSEFDLTADQIGARRGLEIHRQTQAKKTLAYSKPARNRGVVDDAALSMEILFDYNSAVLSADAKEKLRPVGKALASKELKGLSFVVEGHTDAVGGEEFNIGLSEQRAQAVKNYLVYQYGLEPSSIQVIGKGKQGLLDPRNPTSEVNRRVRIISLAD